MANFELPYIGNIDLQNLDDNYYETISFNGTTISIDLNFEDTTISEQQAEKIKLFINSLNDKQSLHHAALRKNLSEGGETADYIDFLLDELEEKLADFIHVQPAKEDNIVQVFNQLKLIRVGFYPQADYGYSVFDYSIFIDGEPCNQLLAVNTDKDGNVIDISWES